MNAFPQPPFLDLKEDNLLKYENWSFDFFFFCKDLKTTINSLFLTILNVILK